MKDIVLITGGCRSGKSGYALKIAEGINTDRKVFIATCVPHDREMKQRVENHQKERNESWDTVEVPVNLPEAIVKNSSVKNVILVDCLTLWINNLMLENKIDNQEKIIPYLDNLIRSLDYSEGTVILVSNEVGTGIVPENKMARLFRDLAGLVNQKIALCSNKVIWMVAGIPVHIK